MNLLKSDKFKNAIRILSAVAILAMAFVGVFVYKADALSLLIFLAFLLIYVQLPGQLLLKLSGIKPEHISTELLFGFFLGWALEVAAYFLTEVIGTNILLYALGPILAIIYVLQRAKARKSSPQLRRFNPGRLSVGLCLFIVIVFLFAMIRTQYLYLNPLVADLTYMNPDKAYHMGIISSLSHGYPVESLWVSGRTISYHIFAEVLYSIPVRLFGLEADFMIMSCCPYMTTYVFGLATYSLFREFCARKERAGVYSLLVILANLFLADTAKDSLALRFALVNENTAGYGVAGAMTFVIMLKYCWPYLRLEKAAAPGRHDSVAELKSAPVGAREYISRLAMLTVMLMLLTGIKGPMGLVMLGGMWGTYFLGLIMRKVKFNRIVPLIVMSAGFGFIYLTVLGSKGQSNAGGNSIIELANVTNICFWKTAVVDAMKSMGLPLPIRLAVVLFLFVVLMFTIYFLPFCIGYIRELFLVLTGKKDFDFTRVTIYAAVMVGMIAMFVLNYSGHSQVYFGFVSLFFAPLISYWLFEELEEQHDRGENRGRLLKALKAIFVVTLIATTISLGFCFAQFFREAKAHANVHEDYDKYMSISSSEVEAMRWLEKNTPEDALIATDRYYSVPLEQYSYQDRWTNRFFLYAVYANRFCYIAGSGYNLPAEGWVIRKMMIEKNEKLYDPENENRGADARELGVNYVVVSKRFTDVPLLSNGDYTLCFSNKDVDIYKVEEAKKNTEAGKSSSVATENADYIPVYAYHRLSDPKEGEYWKSDDTSSLILPVDTFEAQLKYFKDKGYTTLSMDEFYRWYKGEISVPKKSVVLTFDDGNYSVIKYALPLLEKYKMKATVFMIGCELKDITDTSRTEGNSFYMIGRDYYEKTLAEYKGLEFQSHSYDFHRTEGSGERALCAASDEALRADMEKMYNEFGYEYLAYPFGETTERAMKVIAGTHVKMAFGYGEDDYASRSCNQYYVPRIKVNSREHPDKFYWWLENLEKAK